MEANIGSGISDIPDAGDSNGEFTETRPSYRIPANGVRDQRALSFIGTTSSTNYGLEAWIVMETVDVSTNNPYINIEDTNKYISFWTEQRYANGGISALEVFISTDYTNDVTTANWTNVTSSVGQIATSGQNAQTYIESVLDISAYTSTNFTLAFKYSSNNSAYSQTNRNGTFYISDVKYFVSSITLSNEFFELENTIRVYPNPFSSDIKIKNLSSAFNLVLLIDMLGREVYSQSVIGLDEVSLLPSFNENTSGVYFLRLVGDNIIETYKLVRK